MPPLVMWWATAAGYAYGVFVGWFFTRLLSDRLWVALKWRKGDAADDLRPNAWQPQLVGVTERVLYIASLQVEKGEFIGVWLALKVAGQWSRWSADPAERKGIPQGRSIYQNFLIGNSFSILYALIGFKLIGWLQDGQGRPAGLIVAAALVVFTLAVWRLIPAPKGD